MNFFFNLLKHTVPRLRALGSVRREQVDNSLNHLSNVVVFTIKPLVLHAVPIGRLGLERNLRGCLGTPKHVFWQPRRTLIVPLELIGDNGVGAVPGGNVSLLTTRGCSGRVKDPPVNSVVIQVQVNERLGIVGELDGPLGH